MKDIMMLLFFALVFYIFGRNNGMAKIRTQASRRGYGMWLEDGKFLWYRKILGYVQAPLGIEHDVLDTRDEHLFGREEGTDYTKRGK